MVNQKSERVNILLSDNPDKKVAVQEIEKYAEDCHILDLQAPGSDSGNLIINMYKARGKLTMIDYDDYSFDLSPGNPRYQDLGTKEAEEIGPNGEVVFRWKDGENGFDLKTNIAKYEAFKTCLSNVDMITTTTEYLANKFRPYNKKVVICPNSIDFNLWKPIPRPSRLDNEVRIGWFGGDSHFVDLKVFKTLLPMVLSKYPSAKLVLQCPPVPEWREFFREIPPAQLEWNFWAELSLYTLFLASRHWDIGLVPLDDNEFNRCKSNIKCLEFQALGVPVIAQNMVPYSNYIKPGETGFLASTEDEWYEHLCKLIESESKRKEIGKAGYNQAFTDFNLDTNWKNWENAFISLVEGRKNEHTTRRLS